MKRGRPRLAPDDVTVNVSLCLSGKQYDATQKRADDARMTLSDWLRRVIDRACAPPRRSRF